MKLSVHITTCGRLPLLKGCLRSVFEALPSKAEVLVILNGEDEETKTYLASVAHPRYHWLQVPKETLSRCRNRAHTICRGEIIYYLDDDVIVPKHLFRTALLKFEQDPQIAILGGPNLTPPESPFLEKCFGGVMTSPFATPMVRFRYSAKKRGDFDANENHLIFCNLSVTKRILNTMKFNEILLSNEETLFIHEVKKLGSGVRYSRDLYVFHRRRKTIISFMKQVSNYGFGRVQQTALNYISCHPLFLVPALLWLVPLFCLLWPSCIGVVVKLCILYLILSLFGALLSDARAMGPFSILVVCLLTPIVHLSYGAGFWRGIWFTIGNWLRTKTRKPRSFAGPNTDRALLIMQRQ